MTEKYHTNRRDFLKKTSIGGMLALSIPEIVSAAIPSVSAARRVSLKKDAVVLFQGDSITDARRKKATKSANNRDALGGGYAFLAACELLYQYPGKNLSVYNRGISGNEVEQLDNRWEEDCINLKPDVLSILIGVNDYWHKHDGRHDHTVNVYRDRYRALVDRTLQHLPDVQLVIGEPFAIKGIKSVDDSWYPEFDGYRATALEISEEYKATFIPYQSVFEKAAKSASGSYWTYDGVHPSLAGANLMAHAWLKVIGN